MLTRIDPERVRILSSQASRAGKFVLYWMQSSHRTKDNPALLYAIERADHAGLPLVVFFGLDRSYPEARLRHMQFMVEGLADVARSLEEMGIFFALQQVSPQEGACTMARDASLVVVDRGYLRHQREMYRYVVEHCRCPFVQVEGNVVVPVEAASPKEEYSAATFRPKIERIMDRFLHPAEPVVPRHPARFPGIPTLAGEPVPSIINGLHLDSRVLPSQRFRGGSAIAEKRFTEFLDRRLDTFAEGRNDPGGTGSSGMSPYLHFGQVSPITLTLLARERGGAGVPAFLEELIVRRELAVNFVHYNTDYDSFASLPAWARQTLAKHENDPREYLYSRDELEQAATHDPYWNAAQREMVKTGSMQGYMRMYWGKKILEWSPTPKEAWETALSLNNAYEIDGRDPNGYAGVAWCFGKHDRPWKERKIFGMVRYMNSAGLERKFAMDRYLAMVPP